MMDDSAEDHTKPLEDKFQTSEGKLPDPKTLSSWPHNFSKIPEFTFRDLYNYLVDKDDYSPKNLRSFKSLLGVRLFRDGHVVDLKYCPVEGKSVCFFQFKVKPTERAKTEDGQTTYNGFVILNSSGEVHSAFCPCKGGSDGCCRHVAAVLFDLQSTVSNNLMSTCISGKCEWKRRCGNNEYAIPFQDLKIVKAEFGKTEKDPVKPVNFEPGHSSFDASIMKGMLRRGLLEVFPEAVALQFLSRPKEPKIPESLVAKHIADDSNVERYESVENVTLYTLKEYADILVEIH